MEIRLAPKLMPVFEGDARYRGAYGGRGSGKSLSFAVMCLVRGAQKPRRILCAREIQATIRDSVHRELVDAIQTFGFEHRYDYGESFIRGYNGTEFLFKGLRHNYREIKSTTGVDICWVEEAEAVSEESWRVLIPTIRKENSEIHLTWNPEDPDSATHKRFILNPPENSRIVEVNYMDNPWFPTVLEEERQEDLRRYDKHMYEHVWLGKCITHTGLEIYYNFDEPIHISTQAERDPVLPICWSHDFNIGEGKPMSSCLCQIKKGAGPDGKIRQEAHVFDEIVIETADTNHAVKEMAPRYGNKNVIVYGDASGRARDTRSKKTDYMILSEAGFTNQRVPLANPPIRERHNAVNAMLKNAIGDVRVKIHPRCKTLIKGLRTTRLKQGAQYLEDETYSQHVTTAFGYFISREFPAIKRTVTVTGVSSH